MTMLAGSACGGAPDHLHRFWAVDPERCLVWSGAGGPGRFEEPIPGQASVAVADPWRRAVLLGDGEAYQWDRSARRWFARFKEGDVRRTNGPAVIAAGSACDGLWLVTADRRVWRWSAMEGRQPVVSLPLPGTSRPLAVDLSGLTVVFDDGQRLTLVGGRWVAMPGLLEDLSGAVRCRVLSGICLRAGVDILPGQVLDLPEADARRLIARGVVVPAPDAEPSVERT